MGGAQNLRAAHILKLAHKKPSIKQIALGPAPGPVSKILIENNIECRFIFSNDNLSSWQKLMAIICMIKESIRIKPSHIFSLPWLGNFVGICTKIIHPSTYLTCELHGTAYLDAKRTVIDYLLANIADRWTVVSQAVADFLESYAKVAREKIIVANPEIDKNAFLFDCLAREQIRQKFWGYSHKDYFVLGLVCRLDEHKRVDWAIELICNFNLKNSNKVYLLICGDGEKKDDLQKQITIKDCEDFIKIKKFNYEEMAKVYSSLDAVILCSKSEGYPLVVLEALAASRPVILSKNLAACFDEKTKSKISFFENQEDFNQIINDQLL